MKTLNFRNPSMHIPDRSVINAMVSDFLANDGKIRKFDRGHSGEWENMKTLMRGLGYELCKFKRFYQVKRIGAKGRAKNLTWEAAAARIDEILVENGREPFQRRAA